MSKLFVDPQSLLEDSFRLGLKVLKSNFRPNFIIGIWRGGAPPGIAVQEILAYYGIKTDHISVRTSSYENMQQQKEIRVHGLEYLIEQMNAEDRLLIVDDVFDTGKSIAALLEKLREKCRRNMPSEIKIATIYYKPTKNTQDFSPDFYIHESNEWIVFPHELVDLTPEEILAKGIDLEKLKETF